MHSSSASLKIYRSNKKKGKSGRKISIIVFKEQITKSLLGLPINISRLTWVRPTGGNVLFAVTK